MDRFQAYLFKTHNESELRRWAKSLRHFRFCRAYGGHANDGDSFQSVISYTNESDFLSVLNELDLAANRLTSDNPRPEPGHSYTVEEFNRFRTEIIDFPSLEQVGHCKIAGNGCFLWAGNHKLKISVGGGENSYEVSEEDFQRALCIESRLVPLSQRIIDPPQDNRNCICPKYYPEFWAVGGNSG